MRIIGVSKIEYLTKGKRGLIYTGILNGKKIGIKTKNPNSEAQGRIKNEAKYIQLLNKHNIGPKFVQFKRNKLIYKFASGDLILEFIKKSNKTQIKSVLKKVFNQCFILDKLKINKEEMHKPVKHIIVSKGDKPIMLDFERCFKTEKPHNVTQFVQFLINSNLSSKLKNKGFKINKKKLMSLAQKYKHKLTKKSFDDILKEIR